MKRYYIFFLTIVFPLFLSAQNDFDSLLIVLDKTVDNYKQYTIQKEATLDKLKNQLNKASTTNLKYEICRQLYVEYTYYKYDSALIYAQKRLHLAEKLNNEFYITNARLDMANIMAFIGMYIESMNIIKTVDVSKFPTLKALYFQTYRSVYFLTGEYAKSKEEKNRFYNLADDFTDSTMAVSVQSKSKYIMVKSEKLRKQKKDNEALELLMNYFNTQKIEIHTKAMIAYYIASIYHASKDRKLEKYWLTVSSINDLKSATKEYISLRSLAFLLYEDGDIERSYKYIKRALEDALFCNAILKTVEISKMFPVIDNAYQAQTKARQKQLVVSLVIISLLSLFLLVSIFFVYRQMRKLTIARLELKTANDYLNTLNEKLFSTNSQLKNTNKTLTESNLIKEEYIGHYIAQCSVYIEKMDDYRRLLNKIATAGKIDDLFRAIKSKQFIEEELKVFYNHFDNTFLQLFPSFVSEFRKLLIDDEYVQLKPGQLLNTELRIYALIRLGIDDAAKMSNFLRCSMSTIYNYRTKIRNKAIGLRDEFEDKVQQIGA